LIIAPDMRDRECVENARCGKTAHSGIEAMEKMAKLPVRYAALQRAYKSLNPMQKKCGDKDCMVECLRIYEG
jgi:hypothetical protein